MEEPARVLLIDGGERSGRIAPRLSGAGFEVASVGGVQAADELLASTTVDCVVSTYQVPRRDGLEFLGGLHALEAVAERAPDVPRILYTDVVNPDIAREAVSVGLFDYTPANTEGSLDRLVSRVREATAKRRAERTVADLSRVNEVIRNVLTVLVRAESPASVWTGVTSTLVETDAYDSAWVGTVDDGVETRAAAGDPNGADEATIAAAVESVPDGTVAVPPPVERPDRPDWHCAVVPVTDDGLVLVLFAARSGGFDERERDVLAQLGETVRYAIDALDARETLARRERSLQRKTERLSEFASVVSHDLRNPLAVATGNLELAMAGETDRLETVASALTQLDNRIDDILELAREGERSVTPEPVPLRAVCEAAWRTVGTDDARFRPPTDATVLADKSQLSRLFENLFRNSVEHGSTGSRTQSDDAVEPYSDDLRVVVETLADGFAVSDNGPGIPESERERLFEAGVTTANDGTGFGLAIVSDIAAAHGWTVAVHESESGGARFEVTGVEFDEG